MLHRPLNLAIVGCGAIAEHAHLPAAAGLPGVRVTGLVDARRERAETLARRFGVPQAVSEPGRLDPPPDAAVIALPHHLHAPVSLDLLRRGVHVLVEKPMALSVAECDAMIEAAGAAGVRLAVGLVRRFFPVTRLVKAVLETGVLGPLAGFDVQEGRVYDWPATSDSLLRRATAGGGVVADTGVHLLDALLDWLGEVEVVACRDDGRGGVEADAELRLVAEGGVPGVVMLSRARELRNTVQIHGSEGALEASFFTGEVTLRRGGETTAVERSAHLPWLAGTAEGKEVFRAQLADFVDAVRGGRQPAVPGAEGRRSVALLEACTALRRPLVHRWEAAADEEEKELGREKTPLGAANEVARNTARLRRVGHKEELGKEEAPLRAAGEDAGSFPPYLKSFAVDRARSNPDLRGKTVLVTGGTGFIGGRVVEKLALEHGARVRVLVRDLARACRAARCDVELAAGDVTDAAAVECAARGCEVIVHCAYGNRGSAEEQRAVNVAGTAAVVRAALRAGVARLVHVSTIAVYGRMADGDLDETTPYRPPGDLYAETKAEAERLVLDAHRRDGLPAVVVQPTVVYGPHGPVFTVDPLLQLRTRRVVLVDGGEGLCNAVYVDDAAEALILAATRAAAVGEVFVVSGASPVTWRQFYAAYERMLGVAATFSMPAVELRALARNRGEGEDGAGPFRVPAEPQIDFFAARTRVRIDKAERLLGYRPRFDLERGMALTEAWARWAGLLPPAAIVQASPARSGRTARMACSGSR